ncbi:MAG: RNA polymerase sigma factor [Bacteroidota bacterium]
MKETYPPSVTFCLLIRLAVEMSLLTDFQQRVLPVRDKLYRFALRMLGSVEEAEDVVQEVLIKVWSKGQGMQEYLNMEAWCMRLTRNLSLDRLRTRKVQVGTSEAENAWDFREVCPDHLLEIKEKMNEVHRIIESLPDKQKMVIQLRDIEGYSYQEIAEMLEIPMNQVKVNLHRARTKIKDQLLAREHYGL